MADWSKQNVSNWCVAYLLARSLRCSLRALLGSPPACLDCFQRREKWDRHTIDGRQAYICRDCGKFIGYIAEPKA